jgi:putative transposase
MRAQALRARPRRRALPKDDGERSASAIAPNVVDRQFTAYQPPDEDRGFDSGSTNVPL